MDEKSMVVKLGAIGLGVTLLSGCGNEDRQAELSQKQMQVDSLKAEIAKVRAHIDSVKQATDSLRAKFPK